jgi:hypothetical protein
MSQESPPDVQKEQIGGLELQVDAFSPVAPSEVTGNLADNAIERLEEGIRGDAQVGVESCGGKASPPSEEVEITPWRLDVGDLYELNASIWDAMLFLGHPGLGWSVSIGTLFTYFVNMCVQFAFCIVIWSYMLEPEVSASTLDTLLKFRLSIAHNVEFADPITRQSLATQVCNSDEKVHYAAGQMGLLDDVKTFLEGSGFQLMILAEILFMCVIVRELDGVAQFAKAVMSLRRSERTKVVLADVSEEEARAENLYQIPVVARVVEICPLRVYFAWAFIIVPRLIICLFLGVTGLRFIGKTNSLDDLVLNCVAVAFVMDLDEIAYEGFTPRRLKTLVSQVEPIPCSAPEYQVSRRHMPVLWQATKVVLVVASVFAAYHLELKSFFWRLEQVDHILCSQSSNLDFVYARNSANNVLYVTRSQDVVYWTPDEVTLMKATNLEIEPGYDWSPGILDKQAELGIGSDDSPPAIVMGTQTSKTEDTVYSARNYDAIVELGAMSLEQAASSIACMDLGSGSEEFSYLTALRVLLGNTTISSCSDVSWHYCTQRNMTQLRALCPKRCNCHVPPTYDITGRRAFAGYFQSPQGGCPQSCQAQLQTTNQIRFVLGESPFAGTSGNSNSNNGCADLEPHKIVDNSSAGCLVDGTVATDSVCRELPSEAFWWLTFTAGLFERLTADVAFFDNVLGSVMSDASGIAVGLNASRRDELIQWVSGGSMARSFLDGAWELMPGVPHPRSLTGCDYLASFEIMSLLNMDLCSAEEYSSIRFMCPVSCGCRTGQIYYYDDQDWTIAGLYQVSNRREDLRSCPAACVIVHPDISGESSFDGWQNPVYEYCQDSDPKGAIDTSRNTCLEYAAGWYSCEGQWDDTDFTALDMCCQCGGGTWSGSAYYDDYGDYGDYEDWSAYYYYGDYGDYECLDDDATWGVESAAAYGTAYTCYEADVYYSACTDPTEWSYEGVLVTIGSTATALCPRSCGECTTEAPLCSAGCYDGWPGDGYCDDACNNLQCNYDEGDCDVCSYGCYDAWPGDGYCDDACNNLQCNYDGGDCGATTAAVDGYNASAGDCVDASGEYTYIAHYGVGGLGLYDCKSECDSLLSDCKAFSVEWDGLCYSLWVSVRQDVNDWDTGRISPIVGGNGDAYLTCYSRP